MAEPTRGLSRSELRTWRRFTSGVVALLQVLDRDLRDDIGVSLDDFGVLRPLWASPESVVPMSVLADQLAFSPSRLSHTVRRLEDKGWVRREPSSEDKRVKLVRLTSSGEALFADAWPRHAQLIRELFLSQLDDHERNVTEETFAKVRKAARNRGSRT